MKEIGTINYKNSKQAKLIMAGNFLFFAILAVILIPLSGITETNSAKWYQFAISFICYIILHEVAHIAFIKYFSKDEFTISLKFPTISAGSKALFSKRQFVIIALAPTVILGTLSLILLLSFPEACSLLFCCILALNFAVSGGDYFQAASACKYPAGALFQDDGEMTVVYGE